MNFIRGWVEGRKKAIVEERERSDKLLKAADEVATALRQRNILLDEKVQRLESENEYMKAFLKSAMSALNQPAVFSKDQLESLASFVAGVVVSAIKRPGDLN